MPSTARGPFLNSRTSPSTSMLFSRSTQATLATVVRNEPEGRERRQRDLRRVALLVPRRLLGLQTEAVADVRAAVEARVGVQSLTPPAAGRQADPPAVPHDRREVR